MPFITSNLGFCSWILFGALAGWLASIITGRNNRQGCIMNIIVGIVGAFIGGAVYGLITGGELTVVGASSRSLSRSWEQWPSWRSSTSSHEGGDAK